MQVLRQRAHAAVAVRDGGPAWPLPGTGPR
ncbi:hypothetical protein SDIAM103S_00034 [Streptomyces diastaticus subsp. diastaticus]|uniref:Uncharacterized protein n=1 Tax=Streptomyces griseus TaxID=1911 RepID=A0A380N852_STRGR|nr:Uncharacterised protein [Streptomyces griseus]